MRDINKIILLGRLGKDPVLRETKTGRPLVSLTIATSRKYRNEEAEDGVTEETQWHNLTAFGAQAENCKKYLRKGHLVYVEGSLRSNRYEAKDGTTRTGFNVYVDEISFIGAVGVLARGEDSGTEDSAAAQAS